MRGRKVKKTDLVKHYIHLKKDTLAYRIIYRVYGWSNQLKYIIMGHMFRCFPIQKHKIVFDNFGGMGYAGNPRAIAEEILKQNKKWDMVWMSDKKPVDLPTEIRWVRYGSGKALYEMATAKVWVDNIRHSLRPSKRKKQYYIQTWHGGMGVKKVEADALKRLPKNYIKMAKRDGKEADLFLSESKWKTRLYKRAFWYFGDIMKVELYGVASIKEQEEIMKYVKAYFKIPDNKKIILYAPTFRNSTEFDYGTINFLAVLEAASQRFGGEWCIIVRLHSNVSGHQHLFEYSENIVNGTDFPSVEQLLYASEILITDYSSTMVDAMRYGTKVLIYASDYKMYQKKERGFYFDLKKLTAIFAESNQQLIENIYSYEKKNFEAYRERLLKMAGYYSEEKNTYLVVDKISNVMDL